MNAFFEHHQDSIRFGYRCFVGNPVEGERDSVLKANTIPL